MQETAAGGAKYTHDPALAGCAAALEESPVGWHWILEFGQEIRKGPKFPNFRRPVVITSKL